MHGTSVRPVAGGQIDDLGGIVELASGALAVSVRKGGVMHARAGTWFFLSMLVLGVTASILEPLRSPPGSPVGGIIVCYFVATAWMAAPRRSGTPGRLEKNGKGGQSYSS